MSFSAKEPEKSKKNSQLSQYSLIDTIYDGLQTDDHSEASCVFHDSACKKLYYSIN